MTEYVPADEFDPDTDERDVVGVHYSFDGELQGYHVDG